MPLIQYPDVPIGLGVPALVRALTFSQQATTAAQTQEAIASAASVPMRQYGEWQITDADGRAVIKPDSVIDFEWRGESKVASHPVEKGSFAAYNKIATPFDARLTIACGGLGEMQRAEFLFQLETMADSLDLYSIVTPDRIYANCNLVHADYRRDAKQGVTLLLVQLWFQEIRTAGVAVVKTVRPASAPSVSVGRVSPVNPTAKQAASAALPAQ
jgi:hypothetical protein